MSAFQSSRRLKTFVLAGAVTAITISGTLYGAGIKTQGEVTQHAEKAREITLDERLAALRTNREVLMGKRELVERQMRDLETRIEERKDQGVDNKRA